MGLSTHVLDTMHGCPAAGMVVALFLSRVFDLFGLAQSLVGLVLGHTLLSMPFMLRIILPMPPLAASMRECSASARTLCALAGMLTSAGLVTGLKPLPFRDARVLVRQLFIRGTSIVLPLEPVVNGSICG